MIFDNIHYNFSKDWLLIFLTLKVKSHQSKFWFYVEVYIFMLLQLCLGKM